MNDYDIFNSPLPNGSPDHSPMGQYTFYPDYTAIYYAMPTSIHAFGIDYAITFVDKVIVDEEETPESAAQESIGVVKLKEQQIQLLAGVPSDVMKEVILHELLHLCDMCTADPASQLDESSIVRLSSTLFGILRDNPLLVQWLLQKG